MKFETSYLMKRSRSARPDGRCSPGCPVTRLSTTTTWWPSFEQPVTDVGADEPGPAGYEYPHLTSLPFLPRSLRWRAVVSAGSGIRVPLPVDGHASAHRPSVAAPRPVDRIDDPQVAAVDEPKRVPSGDQTIGWGANPTSPVAGKSAVWLLPSRSMTTELVACWSGSPAAPGPGGRRHGMRSRRCSTAARRNGRIREHAGPAARLMTGPPWPGCAAEVEDRGGSRAFQSGGGP